MPSSRHNKDRTANLSNRENASSDELPPPLIRQIASLALFIHLFCVAVVMSANWRGSGLSYGITQVLRPYTQVFNFELFAVPYHLTHATEMDVDQRIEVLPKGKDPEAPSDWILLSGGGWRGSDSYKRIQRLAFALDFYAQQQGNEAPSALIAQSVAEHFLKEWAIEPAQIRCRRHALQSAEAIEGGTVQQQDPWDEVTYFRTPYEANLLVDAAAGKINVVKIDPEGQVAQPGAPQSGTP